MRVSVFDPKRERHQQAGACLVCNKEMAKVGGVVATHEGFDLAYCSRCVRALAAASPPSSPGKRR